MPDAPATAALRFVEDPYHPNDRGNALLHFREQGYTTLRDVFARDSVDAYRQQHLDRVEANDTWWNPLSIPSTDTLTLAPARAPRLLDALRGAFMPWIAEPQPVLMTGNWLVKPSKPDEKLVHDWHKDGDHAGGSTVHGYTYPQVIHTAIYLEDMTPDHGPTYVIPRSHRDHSRSPYAGTKEAPFLPAKGDVVLWDQRLWHRASPRIVDGHRLVAIFAFFAVPLCAGPLCPSPAQRRARTTAPTDTDRIHIGGPNAAHPKA
jgi:hypothetical protein